MILRRPKALEIKRVTMGGVGSIVVHNCVTSFTDDPLTIKSVFSGIQKLEGDITEGKVQPLTKVVRSNGQEQGRTR